jgi:hypothetical protein
MQKKHGSRILYLIVNVENVNSRPVISIIFDDPIRFLDAGKLRFATVPQSEDGGVIGKWGPRLAS